MYKKHDADAVNKAALEHEYLKFNGTVCPNPDCGSADIRAENIELYSEEVGAECHCECCGSMWNDYYKLHRIGELMIVNRHKKVE